MRINEIARSLNVSSKAILEYLETIGIEGKSHSSTIAGTLLDRVREKFGAPTADAGASTPASAPASAPTEEEPKPTVRRTPTVEEVRKALQQRSSSATQTPSATEESVRMALQSQVASRAAAKRAELSARSATEGETPSPPRFREHLTAKAQSATREALHKRLAQRFGKQGVVLRPLAAPEPPPQPAPAPVEPAVAAPVELEPITAEATTVEAPAEAAPREVALTERPLTPEEMARQMLGELESKAEPPAPAEEEEDVGTIQVMELLNLKNTLETPAPPVAPKLPPRNVRQPRTGRTRKSIRRDRRAKIAAQDEAIARREEREYKTLRVHEATTVADVAHGLHVSPSEVIGKLFGFGIMATINQRLDLDTIQVLADEYGAIVEETSLLDEELDLALGAESEDESQLVPRAPVVTVMGHVDHGKTKLLDAIRKTNVVATESGGITQHIGAYRVRLPKGEITFLDTPGHEAFTSMRARGAQVTDIVVLVVAADDGVMPQTIEAINHAKAGDVPIVVAINKIDKPEAQPERVMQQLSEHGLVPEAWGGKTIYCPVSALQRIGIEGLLENILLQAELLELKANPHRRARGTIIEARLDAGRGPVSTLLVQSGTLRVGDAIVVGVYSGRVRAMHDDRGAEITEAAPGVPVEVLGIGGVPAAGDHFYVVESDKDARTLSLKLQQIQREREIRRAARVSLDTFFEQAESEEIKTLNVIVKGDVMGSVDALSEALKNLSTDKVSVNIVHGAVGAVTESDVMLASASDAVIIGFKVRSTPAIDELARRENVEIRHYDVIYAATEEVKAAMHGLLDKKFEEQVLGRAEVRETFRIARVGTVAGCYVSDGKLVRNGNARLIRDGAVVHEGRLSSLKRFKDDVREVAAGFECGTSFEGYNNIKVGDVIECYEVVEIEQTL